MRVQYRVKWTIFAVLTALLVQLALPLWAFAGETEQKVVRVGWFESTYSYHDANGERRGILYEYQRRIAAHTGWTYEYVEDSWPNLFQMLVNGEIDLLSDVSYTKERESLISYPALAMGAESYYIYVDADNTDIDSENLQTLNGKRVGVNQGSVQEGMLRDWVEKNHITPEILPFTDDEAFTMTMLARGDVDAIVAMDSYGAKEQVVPMSKIGASDYYLAVNKRRQDLLSELNNAMSAIQDEDPYFNQRMFDQYVYLVKTNAFLSSGLESWLEDHGPIRVGYWDRYLPFCASDGETGELTGALSDFLLKAANILKNAQIPFQSVPYPSVEQALEALKRGEVDCVFPVNLSTYQGETMGILTVNPIMQTEMNILMRAGERPEFKPDQPLTVAIERGNTSFETLVHEVMPNCTVLTCETLEDCFRAVAEGEADGTLACLYRLSDYEDLRAKYALMPLPTGETMGLSFAMEMDQPEMYSILNKISNLSAREDMEYALVSYMYSDQKITFMDFLEDNWMAVVGILSAVFIVIVVLLIQKLKAQRKASQQQRMLEEAAEVAKLKQTITSLLDNMPGMTYTKDAETGAYLACNRAFAAYARKKGPEEVLGRTAGELFDEQSAKRFQEDDRIALSMEEPYIFFEDVKDAAGNSRQIKTTKLKYTDAAGRLCVLGSSVDVTADTVRIHRGDISSRESYEKARSTGMIFAHIAQALARGYRNLYYVNLDSEEFIEYRTDDDTGSLSEVRRGWHFFEQCELEIREKIYAEDQDGVRRALDRKTLVAALDQNNTFYMTYRLNGAAEPVYVSMKVTRMKDDERYIILAVTDVDEQMRQRLASQRVKEERIAYARLNALSGDILCVYVVVPETGRYRKYSATGGYESFALPKEGADFFADSRRQGGEVIYPEDLNRFLTSFTGQRVMEDIHRYGIYTLSYRLMMEGRPRYVQLKAAMMEEKEGQRLIVGISDIDTQVRQEEEYVKNLARARIEASIDALTGVKNRHAYLMAEERLNEQIRDQSAPAFAVVVLDVNDLKKVNDNEGHEAGDQLLRDACKIVCNVFQHSPVFRVGGDEFAVISQGRDLEQMDALVEQMAAHNRQSIASGGIVIACGMARMEQDDSVATVFERADQEMYRNKSALKQRKAALGRS